MTKPFTRIFVGINLLFASIAAADDIAAKIAAAKGTYDGADYVVVLHANDITVADSGIGTNDCTRVVKVLTDAGIKSQSVQHWSFDPTTNTLELKSLKIHRAAGPVETIDVKRAVTQPESAWGIFWGSHETLIEVPGLKVGDAVEMHSVKTGSNTAYLGGEGGACVQPPMPGHWYDVVNWQESVPVIERRYTVRISRNKPLQYEIVNGTLASSVKFDGDQAIYTFEKKDIPPFKHEPHMVSGSDVMCKLVLATLNDWHAKARWFYEANEPSFKKDEAISAKVRELLGEPGSSGLSDEEKIAKLNHWVAENVRYVGTSRGAHEGYTTHPASE
ncbi:MAG TPA: DUF3857 domain-containing protein, partial [Phycisphaerae bacterium]|nr:DUF3857 domain-containing protein [Phycisphaerae bacterium]